MAAGLSTEALKDGEAVEDLLALSIIQVKFGPRDDVGGEPGHVLADLKLGLAISHGILQRLDHLVSALHHVHRIALQTNPSINPTFTYS